MERSTAHRRHHHHRCGLHHRCRRRRGRRRVTGSRAPREATAAMTDQLTHLSATELAARIRDGRTTSTEVVDAHIAVLERIEHLNALAVDRFDLAREEAAAADKR